jgi:glycosyltransferase involved in cell wall biosynthesis
VTIEAMMSRKPVITVTDAGGPTEFVENGDTGFCVPPDPDALAEKIDDLCRHREAARRMGETGYQRVSAITWDRVVNGLLDVPDLPDRIRIRPVRQGPATRLRKKLTVAVTFPVFPPRGGGQARVFQLYRHLAAWWDIEIVTLTHSGDAPFKQEIAPGVTEIRIPRTRAHDAEETRLSLGAGGVPVTDAAMPRLYSLTPEYSAALTGSASDADAVVASHPYLVDALMACAPDKPLWFEAHNVEIDLKDKILSHSDTAQALLEDTKTVERRCWEQAALIYACTQTDLDRLARIYGDTRAVRITVPNGVCVSEIPFTPLSGRRAVKARLGAEHMPIALFIGSWHGPNLEAIERIIGFARRMPQVTFLVLGSGGLAFGDHDLPMNLGLTGVVEDEMKALILSLADVALNPMTSGSGTNLKMLEYFAAGIPVISTPFGMRGLGSGPEHLKVSDIASFPDAIDRFFACPVKNLSRMIDAARTLTVERYDWPVIARNMHDAVRDHTDVWDRRHP